MLHILLIYMFVYLIHDQADATIEKCMISNGRPGYCRSNWDCPKGHHQRRTCAMNQVCCPISDISIKKCHEYSKYVYVEEQSGALMPRSTFHNVSQCRIEAVPLIVGGEKAHAKEFPHMVAVGYGKSIAEVEWMCGGSLISEKFVLSAAHCAKSRDKGYATFARIGDLDLKRTDDEARVQDFIIVDRILHPGFQPPSRYHDIALFKLSHPVDMDGFSRPACLHTDPDEIRFREVIATGWGKLNYNDKAVSDYLMKVPLSIIKYPECNKTFVADFGGSAMHDGVIHHQICAGELQGGKDTCQGDSGGPIQIVADYPYCMYSIVGITSFGKFCGFKNSPAVYTRVSYYVPWIESIVWP